MQDHFWSPADTTRRPAGAKREAAPPDDGFNEGFQAGFDAAIAQVRALGIPVERAA